MTTALLLIGIAYCIWKGISLLIDYLLIDPLIDILEGEDSVLEISISIECEQPHKEDE